MYPSKPPSWKNVQGRPKSAAVVSSNPGNRKPHSSKISRATLERSLPFTVGQVSNFFLFLIFRILVNHIQ